MVAVQMEKGFKDSLSPYIWNCNKKTFLIIKQFSKVLTKF